MTSLILPSWSEKHEGREESMIFRDGLTPELRKGCPSGSCHELVNFGTITIIVRGKFFSYSWLDILKYPSTKTLRGMYQTRVMDVPRTTPQDVSWTVVATFFSPSTPSSSQGFRGRTQPSRLPKGGCLLDRYITWVSCELEVLLVMYHRRPWPCLLLIEETTPFIF